MSDKYDDIDISRIGEILAKESVWADPPGHVAPALMAEITGDEIASRPAGDPRARSRWFWPGAAAIVGGTAVLLLFLVFGGFGDGSDGPGLFFAVTGDGVSGQAEVGAAEAGWWIRIDIEGLDPAPEGSYYEGWLTDGTDSVSVGTFHMRDGKNVTLWSGVPMTEYPEFSVTRELIDEGPGSSGEVVATGRLSD